MKCVKLVLILMVALVLGIPMVHAQSIENIVRADVPFQFSVNGKTADPGEYFLSATQEKTLAVRDHEGRLVAMVMTTALDDFHVQSPKLVFRHVGDRYYLSQVWLNNAGDGREVRVPKSEKIKLAQFKQDGQVAVVPAK